jgi:hypothetical protein
MPAGPVERSVNRAAACVFVLCCTLAVRARGDGGDLEVRLAWPGDLVVRCGIPFGASRLVLIGSGGPGGAIRFVAGFDGPFVRAGPLAAAGLLREIAGPLGFRPGTDVGREPTGLRLDASPGTSAEASVQLTLIPEALALFWLRPAGELGLPAGVLDGVLGATLGPVRLGPVRLEAAAALGEPGLSRDGEDWTRDGPPHPPGPALQGGARVRLDLPLVSVAVSAGLSAAERAPPGWFAIGMGTFGNGEVGVDLLAAAASVGYLELGGGDDPGGMKAGVRLRLVGRSGRLVARYILSVDLPGFAPGPFLGTGEGIDIALDRWWPSGAATWTAGLSASNRIESGADGGRRDDPTGRASVGWEADRFVAGLAVDIDRDDGVAVTCSLGTGEIFARTSAALEAGWASGGGAARLRFSATAGREFDSGEATLRAGIDDVPLVRGGLRAARARVSFGWRVTAPADPAPAGRVP